MAESRENARLDTMTALDPALWAKLSPALDGLLALPAAEREPRLAALESTEPTSARELRALLQAHDEAARAGFLEAPADPPRLASAAGPVAGDTLGAWTLVAVIGEGGMGRVWHARRNDGRFEGDAAIKLLRNGLADPAAQARFRREGAFLARLRHPGIAQLLDAGVSAAGQPYLVLEFVRGERLDRWCTSHALDLRRRIALFLQVLDAVAAAHAQLVIHRDLKPSNILVDDAGCVKLLDFGIAKLVAEDDEGDEGAADAAAPLTRAGAAVLTPQYAAPEQLAGSVLTTATDVYALGVVLCELLTGRHPSGLPERSSARAYLEAATAGAVARASTLAPASRQALRGDLDNIVAKALAPEPAARYASAAAFADDLRRYLRREPVLARAATWRYRAARLVQRRPLESALAVALALSLMVGAAVALWQAREAALARDRALRELAASEAANAFVGSLLSESGGAAFTTADLLARGEAVLARGFEPEPSIRARLLMLVGSLWAQLDDYARAHVVLVRASEEAGRAHDAALTAEVDCTRAHVDAARGDAAGARALFDAAEASLRRAGDDARAALAGCLYDHADVERQIAGDPARALRLARQAEALLPREQPAGQRQRSDILQAIGDAESDLGHAASAVSSYEAALANLRADGREHSVYAADAWNRLGVAYSRGGLPLRALEAYGQTGAIDRGLRPEAQPTPAFESNRGKLLFELGRAREALPILLAAHERAKALGNRHGAFHTATIAAIAFCAEGDLATCGALLRDAEDDLKAVFPPGNTAYANWEEAAARLDLARGDAAAALKRLVRAESIYRQAKRRSPFEVRALALLCRVELGQGLLAQARAHAQRLDELARAMSGGFSPTAWLGIASLTRSRLKRAEGDAGAAEALRTQALAQLGATLGDAAPETRQAREPGS